MKKILLPVLSVLFCSSLTAQNSAVLKLNLEKNKVYRLKSISEQTVSRTVNGIQQNVVTNSSFVMSLKMIDMTKDFIVAEIHLDTIITNSNSMGKTTIINSGVEGNIASSDMGDIMSCIMNRLSRNALFVKMDFTGRPVEIVNLKMLSDMILKDTSSITLTGPMAAAVKNQVEGSIGDESLKKMIEMFTWTLPAKEVTSGETWNMTQQTNSGGMLLDIKTALHLDEINGSLAKISAESNISAAANAAPIQSGGGATVTYDNLQGLSKSDIVIDIRTGLVVDEKAKTHISGNLGVSTPGGSMQIPLDISGETIVRSLQ
jgi:hypothetical protein